MIQSIDQFVQTFARPETIQRAKTYHRQGNVRKLLSDREGEWKAVVLGHEIYDVHFTIEHGIPKTYSCTCPAYEAYPGLCKHLIACLYEYEIRQTPAKEVRPKEQKGERDVNRLIDSFADLFEVEASAEKEELLIEYIVHVHPAKMFVGSGFVEVELKIGIDRTYVVFDLLKWLEALEEQRTYFFTKNFSFNPDEHKLTDEDQEKMDLLLTIVRMREDDVSFRGERRLFVPGPAFSSLLSNLNTTQLSLVIHQNTMQIEQVHLPDENNTPLQISVMKTDSGGMLLHWTNIETSYYFGSDYRAILTDDTLYFLSEEQNLVFVKFFHRMQREEGKLHIPHRLFEQFYSYVLMQLKKVAKVVIEPEVEQKIQQHDLKATLYVDEVDQQLHAKLQFSYGEHTFNPHEEQVTNADYYQIRDIKQENQVMAAIEQVPFTYNERGLTIRGEEEMAQFLLFDLNELAKSMDINVSENVQERIYTPTEMPTVEVNYNQQHDWLDINFQFSGLDEEESISLLKAMREKRSFVQLNNGQYVNLTRDELKNMSDVLDQLGREHVESTSVQAPLYHAFQLNEEAAVTISDKVSRCIQDIESPKDLDVSVPTNLDTIMRDYQKTGFQWMTALSKYGFGGILADDMGLGKTIQTIAYLAKQYEERQEGKSLIISPASLVYNWQREIERFAPQLDVVIIDGTKEERKKKLTQDAQLFITSYPLIQRDEELYAPVIFDHLVLDEAQHLKNEQAKTTKVVRSLRKRQAFALSGTPVENKKEELYSIFSIVMPELFGSKRKFSDLDNRAVHRRIKPFLLRRLKTEVLKELPEKQEIIQYTELSELQKQLYVTQVEQISSHLSRAVKENAFQEERFHILAGLTKLRQICCHPGLVMEEDHGRSGKLDFLLDYVEQGIASGKRMVIFSQFTSMLAIIKKRFDERQFGYHYLDGSTPVPDRLTLTQQFNEGEHSLFLISLKAGGTGLNLTGGDTVILYDLWWNPAVEEQAADRVHRFGQTKQVDIVRLVTTGTIEEKIAALQQDKKSLIDDLIQPGETLIQSMNPEELHQLIAFN